MAGRRVMLLGVAWLWWGVGAGTEFADCTHNSHCDTNPAAAWVSSSMGFMRYSIPTCSPRGNIGTPCSPAYTVPASRTLYYPNGVTLELEEAHFGLCPCRSGLVCTSGACQLSGPDSSNQGQIAPDHSASMDMSNSRSSED
ncbi:Astakine [Chionoecetes opilio]|uniref:Astakine n=1 Tax=Chionoecetes opilio TaxID=41210 RepID=A0A8J5CLC4_CHIOP|nr:Astakine [Chionoecetes opilio]